MAIITMPSAAEPLVTGSVDQTNAELGQLLLRLQSEILFVDPAREKRLRSSQLERARIDRVHSSIKPTTYGWRLEG